MKSKKLLTAPQVATICATDLKTIHNWVNRGEIDCFRTPGRHLRFRREDIVRFLNRFGYPVPPGLWGDKAMVIIVDPVQTVAAAIARYFEEGLDVQVFSDYLPALIHIGKHRPLLVALNASVGQQVLKVADSIKKADAQISVLLYGSDVKGVIDGPMLHTDWEWVTTDNARAVGEKIVAMTKDGVRRAS